MATASGNQNEPGISPRFSLGVLKEPRGFIKLPEFILSIFAFATTCSISTSSSFHLNCWAKNMELSIDYPFNLELIIFDLPDCNISGKYVEYNGKASSEFYVFIGVVAFLYCLVAIILYIFFDEVYRKNSNFSIADFIISAFLSVFWLISSSVWAQGVSDLKYYSDPSIGLFPRIQYCQNATNCSVNSTGNFATLDVSIIFGFLNTFVWVGNLWFLYKETPWFKVQAKPPTTPGTESETDPQRV